MIVFIYENITSEEAKSKSIDFYEKVTKTSLGKLSKTEKGKPVLDYGFISVSHTKNIVCVAISEKEIGIDHRQICACLLGKQKTCHGYKWKYKESD